MTSKTSNPNRLSRSRKISGARNLASGDVRPAETEAHAPSDPAEIGMPGSGNRSKRRNGGPKRRPHPEADYEVGYGRTPKHTRFQPGKSGNPNGRLPQSRNMKTIMEKVLAEQVQIRDGGRLKRMTKMEAAVRVVVSRLFNSGPTGVASFFVMMKQSGVGNGQAESSPDLLQGVDHEAVLKEYLARVALEAPTEVKPPSDDPVDESDPRKKGKA